MFPSTVSGRTINHINYSHIYIHIYIYICISVCVSVCLCVFGNRIICTIKNRIIGNQNSCSLALAGGGCPEWIQARLLSGV